MYLFDLLDVDIGRCKEAIETDDAENIYKLCVLLYRKYLKIVDGMNLGVNITGPKTDTEAYKDNLRFMKEKLELFKGLQEEHLETERFKQQQISVSNHNENKNEITIDMSFSNVRKQIENMSALPDSEIEEILSKINLLEEIVLSSDRKSKKWDKAKEVITWIAEKGVDVGIALLPLLLEIK